MPYSTNRVARVAIAFCLLAAPVAAAVAACTTPQDFILQVGDVSKDRACRFSDIQKAIDAATCPGSTILITPSLNYTAQHLNIKSKDLLLYGGVKCSDAPSSTPGPQVAISGAGQTSNSVVNITGTSNVVMQNLFITGGNLGADKLGGGIWYDGAGSLSIANVAVYGNAAGYGGGIYMKGEKHLAQLSIGANTLVEKNSAYHDGGGVYLDVNSGADVSGTNTSIYANIALGINLHSGLPTDGFGGGIAVARAASVTISAGGVAGFGGGAGLGAIDSNTALRGGGVALIPIDTCVDSSMTTVAPDASHALAITNNHASLLGGALYARPHAPPPGGFCPRAPSTTFNDTYIAANSAADGAAFYLDWDTQLGFADFGYPMYMNWGGQDPALPDNPKFKPAVTCAGASRCNVIENNVARDDNGKLTKGSLIFVGISGTFWANRVIMRRNTADNLIYIRGDNDFDIGDTRLTDALLVDNTLARSVITQENDDAPVFIDSSTIAHNTNKGDYVLNVHSSLNLTDGLIGETAKALNYSGDSAHLSVANVVATNGGGLPLAASVIQMDPGFIDPANGNYALADKSPALDFAPATTALMFDLVGAVRNVDLPDIPNRLGLRDLGAFERNINVAAMTNGTTASASSTYSIVPPAVYAPANTIDGDRTGVRWSLNPGGGWNDDTLGMFPDNLDIDFHADRTIDRVIVYSLQDNFMLGMEPTDAMTFAAYGLTSFSVQRWDAPTSSWVTLRTVTGNSLVKRSVDFPQVTTSKLRILCTGAADMQYSRIVEVEAFGG
ncbi:MAG: discoidin domain-containing protein [Rudaea sp.]